MRKIPVPAHRYSPLRDSWGKIFSPLVENLHLQVRFNMKTRNVEMKVICSASDCIWLCCPVLQCKGCFEGCVKCVHSSLKGSSLRN